MEGRPVFLFTVMGHIQEGLPDFMESLFTIEGIGCVIYLLPSVHEQGGFDIPLARER